MLVLALDTSSPALSCALVELRDARVARVLAESLHLPPERHGDLLPAALLALPAQAGLSLDDVQGLAVGLGPGSFTGLRVGLACAKSLAYARKLPLAGASSLLALAEARLGIPTLEARRDELYALIDGGEAAYRPAQLVERLNERPFILTGPGAAACKQALLAAGVREEQFGQPGPPPARQVAALCAERLQGARYQQEAVFALQPNYLQPSMAEVALAEGRVGGLPPR